MCLKRSLKRQLLFNYQYIHNLFFRKRTYAIAATTQLPLYIKIRFWWYPPPTPKSVCTLWMVPMVKLNFTNSRGCWKIHLMSKTEYAEGGAILDRLSQLVTHSGPNCKFSWLCLFAIKNYRNVIISIIFYCFTHL